MTTPRKILLNVYENKILDYINEFLMSIFNKYDISMKKRTKHITNHILADA